MKMILLISACFFVLDSSAQYPDSIAIQLAKNNIHDYTDCSIKIKVNRKDKQPFISPVKYYIGNQTQAFIDLVYIVEKMDTANEYKNYLCKYINIPMYDFKIDPPSYEEIKQKLITDNMSSLQCIDSGKYRLRLAYNRRRNDGYLDAPNLTAFSNWVYFTVEANEILLTEYRRKRQKELEKKNR
jgi:hypothetical protein